MKKTLQHIIAVMLIMASILNGIPFTETQAAARPVIRSRELAVMGNACMCGKGDKHQLTARYGGKNITKKCTWKSSRKSVASVSRKGMLKGKKAGTAYITVKYKGKTSKKLRVNVIDNTEPVDDDSGSDTDTDSQTEKTSAEKNPEEEAALREIIANERGTGYKPDLDSSQYEWNEDGNLISIDWSENEYFNGRLLFSAFKKLEKLKICSTYMTELDVSENECLTYLDCSTNRITELNVANSPDLAYLNCGSNSIESLDVSHNPSLTELNCFANNLKSLDVSYNPALTKLICSANRLRSLDVSSNPNLTYLHCASDSLGSLDVSSNPKLIYLNCAVNGLVYLDVSNNPGLTELYCFANDLTVLDISGIQALEGFQCDSSVNVTGY